MRVLTKGMFARLWPESTGSVAGAGKPETLRVTYNAFLLKTLLGRSDIPEDVFSDVHGQITEHLQETGSSYIFQGVLKDMLAGHQVAPEIIDMVTAELANDGPLMPFGSIPAH